MEQNELEELNELVLFTDIPNSTIATLRMANLAGKLLLVHEQTLKDVAGLQGQLKEALEALRTLRRVGHRTEDPPCARILDSSHACTCAFQLLVEGKPPP